MDNITNVVGQRLRTYRQKRRLTQEELAEKAGLHPTYIGQVERGEKNLTLLTLEKILCALDISFSDLFEHIQPQTERISPAEQCFHLVSGRNLRQQESIYRILCELDDLLG